MLKINDIRDFISGLDRREFVIYSSFYVGLCFMLVVGIMVRHIYLIQEAQDKVTQLNQARSKVQQFLTDFAQVAQQRSNVDALLKKDKNFYLQKFFQDLTQRIGMFKNATDKPSTQKLENGYTEDSLLITLTQITTQQLCVLLQAIEAEARVYIKNIDISKVMKKINVTIVIATLIPKSD